MEDDTFTIVIHRALAFVIVVIGALLIIFLIRSITKTSKLNRYLKVSEIQAKDNAKMIAEMKDIISLKEYDIVRFQYLTENQKLEFDKNEADIKLKSQDWALNQFEKFKTDELAKLRKNIEENAINAALNMLHKWKIENEGKIRQDAVNRSYAVNLGKITEHLVPFHTNFPFNPKDARFIGSPIDLVVFDGLSDELDEVKIYFLEIKSGKSVLSKRQKAIKSAVLNSRIIWHEINADDI
jgi:predicted Holliday junction resolvase-like endonuclease